MAMLITSINRYQHRPFTRRSSISPKHFSILGSGFSDIRLSFDILGLSVVYPFYRKFPFSFNFGAIALAGNEWWEQIAANSGEGMVVKSPDFLAYGKRGLL